MNQLELFDNLESPTKDLPKSLEELKKTGESEAFDLFRRNILLALLHRDPSKYRIIDRVIEQAKVKGLTYVLCKISNEARQFRSLARQVGGEYHRATAFMRLKPIDQHRVLYGEFEIKHQSAEMIIQHFTKRFPQYNIMLVFGEEAYIARNKEIYKEKIDREKVNLPQQKDEFEKYWLTFYKTQFIPQRKNLRYLKRMIPKKYWRWVTELGEFGLT